MSEGSGACALRSSGTRLLQARLAPGASQITGVQERSISQFGAPTGNRSRSVTRMATFAGRWPSFASHAADVGYSVTRLVEQCADAKLTISVWRSMLAREVASRYGPRTATGPSSVRKHD